MEMPLDNMPLQELSFVSLQGSMLSQQNTVHKRKSRGGLSQGLESECTPTELTQQWSPRPKYQRVASKGKENEGNHFVLARRPRKSESASASISWERLPDELLLRIFSCLPLHDLLRASVVCKRWRCLAFDESLWHSVDLEGLTDAGPALQQVLRTGICRLRCPHAFVEELTLKGIGPLKIVEMDLSNSTLPLSALEDIMDNCKLLQCLSLEGLQLSDNIMRCLAENPNLLHLNLSTCSKFSAPALADMLNSCSRIKQLNISWCSFDNDHVKSIAQNLSPTVTDLNLSGYRDSLTLDDLKVLVERCPQIQTLDISDSTLLTTDSFCVLKQLQHLQHLSLSRCYRIPLAAVTALGKMCPALHLLDIFGLAQDTQLPPLKKEMPQVSINSRPFSSVARPTPASKMAAEHTMWNRTCRLRFRL
ncbi:unnamed protein product [Menidia menidia]|uniref:S-phase kinase-associated protein 2 n=1 Tax=Menidia menidia TaxID=238744 RepID=A0A8S4AGL9_9TELE|nr:unnamed protein product [Menidia menidia]